MKEQTFHDEDSLNPKQWRSLTDHQRYLLIDRLFVFHQRLLPICEAFEQTAKRAEDAEAKTPCAIALLGDIGVGKTAVAKLWMSSAKARHTAFQGEEHIHYQYISASPSATQKAFLAQWLAVCNDPNWGRGTRWDMERRLQSILRANHIQLVVIDNFHHLIHSEKRHAPDSYRELLAFIFSTLEISAIFIGRSGITGETLHADAWLSRRIEAVYTLQPFHWDRRQPATIREFRLLLRTIDQALPLDASDLDEEDLAYRFFYATDGIPKWLFKLICTAANAAVRTHATTLTRQFLADAFDEHLATRPEKGNINPFSAPGFHEA